MAQLLDNLELLHRGVRVSEILKIQVSQIDECKINPGITSHPHHKPPPGLPIHLTFKANSTTNTLFIIVFLVFLISSSAFNLNNLFSIYILVFYNIIISGFIYIYYPIV